MGGRRRRATGAGDLGSSAASGTSTPWAGDGEWPAHPWVALVERLGGDSDPGRAGELRRVSVIWWQTAAGRQPVLLVRRIRLE